MHRSNGNGGFAHGRNIAASPPAPTIGGASAPTHSRPFPSISPYSAPESSNLDRQRFASAGVQFGAPPPGYVAGAGRGLGDRRREFQEAKAKDVLRKKYEAKAKSRRSDSRFQNDEEIDGGQVGEDDEDQQTRIIPGARALADDEFGLFADAVYEDDDAEADSIYKSVESRLAAKRNAGKKSGLGGGGTSQFKATGNPSMDPLNDRAKMQGQFASLKRALATVPEDDWMAIPDTTSSQRNKRLKPEKQERFTPTPDSLLQERASRIIGDMRSANLTIEDPLQGRIAPVSSKSGNVSGTASGIATSSVGAARGLVLGQKLDRLSGTSTSIQSVDATGYLTQMAGMQLSSTSDIGDIKKARLLLRSVTSTNQQHVPGWIAAARLEELAGVMQAAKDIISEGCIHCSKSEDVWLEAARIHGTEEAARKVLAAAVQAVPRSVKIWLQAARIESSKTRQRLVLRRGLEIIPKSAQLWRALIELEDSSHAKALLERAVECAPGATDLWLAWAKLEPYEKAKDILNRALEAIPAEPLIWITAAQLEEAQLRLQSSPSENDTNVNPSEHTNEKTMVGSLATKYDMTENRVDRLVSRAVSILSSASRIVKREQWLNTLRDCDKSGYPQVCKSIVRHGLTVSLHPMDIERVLKVDAETLASQGSMLASKAIYEVLIEKYPTSRDVWYQAVRFEIKKNDLSAALELLRLGVDRCPTEPELWILYVNTLRNTGDIESARRVLNIALCANSSLETLWLQAIDLEIATKDFSAARELVKRACSNVETSSVFLFAARLERTSGSVEGEREVLLRSTGRFPQVPTFWLLLAQNYKRAWDLDMAKSVISKALEEKPQCEDCRNYPKLWIELCCIEEHLGFRPRARAVLDRARQYCPGAPDLWLLSSRFELLGSMHRDVIEHDYFGDSPVSILDSFGLDERAAAVSTIWKGIKECKNASVSCGTLWAELIDIETPAQQKARSVDALKACDQDADVMAAVARLFWRQRKPDKAKAWFLRAVAADPTNGDAWAALFAFERNELTSKPNHGNDSESRQVLEEVISKCVQAKACHGQVWMVVKSTQENESLDVRDVVQKASLIFDTDSRKLQWFRLSLQMIESMSHVNSDSV